MRNVESNRDSQFFIRSDPCFFPAHAFPLEQWQCQLALFLGSDINNELMWKACRCARAETGRRNAWIQLCIQRLQEEEEQKKAVSRRVGEFVGTGGFKLLRLEVHCGTEPNGFPVHLYECA